MLCWGSWANVLKIAKGWRFELLYYDYSIGVALGAALAGLDLRHLGIGWPPIRGRSGARRHHQLLCGFAGGVIFNLSNILVVGAIAVAGMGVAIPHRRGLALVVGVIWNYFVNPKGIRCCSFVGVALVVGAIIVDAIAYRAHAVSQSAAGDKADAAAKRAATWKGIRLAVIGGILMGMFYPLVEIGKSGEQGTRPLRGRVRLRPGCAGLGLSCTTSTSCDFRLRAAAEFCEITCEETAWVHFLGIVGGIVWIAGSLVELRRRQRSARVAGGAGDQLRHRARLDHGGSALGRPGVEGVRRRRSDA